MSTLPDALENTTARKRQRSTSGASESGGSSPKRAASEGPSLTSESGMRSSAGAEFQQPLSHLSIIEDHDIEGSPVIQRSTHGRLPLEPLKSWTLAQKLQAFTREVQAPLVLGASWYMVAARWLKDWAMACRGESDKQGHRHEDSLGPVDNSPLVDGEGELKPDLLYPEDYEIVPQSCWERFVEWYGTVNHVLERKVTTRGDSQELFVECYVPRLRLFRLHAGDAITVTGPDHTIWIQISLRTPAQEFFDRVCSLFEVAFADIRLWRTSEPITPNGTDYPVGLLRTSTAEPFDVDVELHKALGDLLVNPSDQFIAEIKKDGRWIVDSDAILRQRYTLSQTPSQLDGLAALRQFSEEAMELETQPLFKSGGFFGEMSNRLGIASSGNVTTSANSRVASSSTLKPPATITPRKHVNSRTPGTLGLGNLGNTCFMNSALQCLAHTEELTEYFITDLYREEINRDNPLGMGGSVAEQFGSLLTRIWGSTTGPSSYSPREFKQQLQRFAPQFSGYQQQDSQELVAFLLDGLHEDLNRVVKKPYVENPDWAGGGDKELVELAQKSWAGYVSRNDSAIVDLFQGQYKSTLVCPECQKVSITFDPFMYLTLPLPIKKKWRHEIFYVPWDIEKPHLRIPVEIDYDASFKELRRVLGKWTGSDPDRLMTLEVFQSRFYKFLDDNVLVSDMGQTDQVMCYELPCKTYLNGKPRNPVDDEMLILPVCTSPMKTRSYSAHYDFIGLPFFVALTDEQSRSFTSIYAAITERMKRWTSNAKSLYKYVGVDHVPEDHIVPLVNGALTSTAITEIRENGDIIMTQAPLVEEADIADEKPVTFIEDDIDMEEINSSPTTIGPQADLFEVQLLNFASSRTSMESGSYGTRETPWADRSKHGDKPLVVPGDLLLCKWDESFLSFFLNENALWNKDHFTEFVHPEYEAGRKQAEKRQAELTIDDCLDEFTKEERLGEDDLWYCPQCKKHQQATKNLQLWKVPDVLVVHLKRFSNSRTMRDKLDAFIDFPMHGLDVEERVGERQSAKALATMGYDVEQLGLDVAEPLLYDLYAVDEHLGGLGGGHYRAYAVNHIDGEWYYFDDSHVTRCRPEEAVNRNAYLLFYRRRTSRPIGGKTHAKIQAARQLNSDKSLLPTPPSEPSPPSFSQPIGPSVLDEDISLSQQSWTPSLPSDTISPSSSSPPDLEESDAPPGLENDIYDALENANIRYAMPGQLNGFQGHAGSPTSSSSNEAEDGGSESGASPPWDQRVSNFIPSAAFTKAVLKPASFGPTYGNSASSWGSGQEPPSSTHSSSDFEGSRTDDHALGDVSSHLTVAQLPSPEPEDFKAHRQ